MCRSPLLTVSEFHNLLRGAQAALEVLAGSTFTVDGVSGTFTGILDVTTTQKTFGESGMVPDDTARLTIKQGLAYTPDSGDLITCEGVTWKAVSVKKGRVEYEIELIGVDQ